MITIMPTGKAIDKSKPMTSNRIKLQLTLLNQEIIKKSVHHPDDDLNVVLSVSEQDF